MILDLTVMLAFIQYYPRNYFTFKSIVYPLTRFYTKKTAWEA